MVAADLDLDGATSGANWVTAVAVSGTGHDVTMTSTNEPGDTVNGNVTLSTAATEALTTTMRRAIPPPTMGLRARMARDYARQVASNRGPAT